MKIFTIIILFTIVFNINADEIRYSKVQVAAERTDVYLPKLEGKSVAIVGNQTSMIGKTHLVDSLVSLNVNIVKIFAPEHGFRGFADAGETVKDGKDSKTGLPVISLYGKHKKPTTDDLKNVDIIVFDIQDVGTRFYTYISTLQLVMEACSENNKEILILDRPNPNGYFVDGPVLKPKYKSFIGMQPIPIVYGMSIAEYAKMINEEGWMKDGEKCNLDVVTCQGWDHTKFYKLPVKPSPNLPNMVSVYYYPTLCLLEGTVMSVGRGTGAAFQLIGHPNLSDGYVNFTPKSIPGAKHPKFEGVECKGYDVRDKGVEYIVEKKGLDIIYVEKAYSNVGGGNKFFKNSFNLLAGNSELKKQIQFQTKEREIKASWKKDLDAFKLIRKKYLLYKDFE